MQSWLRFRGSPCERATPDAAYRTLHTVRLQACDDNNQEKLFCGSLVGGDKRRLGYDAAKERFLIGYRPGVDAYLGLQRLARL